MKPGSAIKEYLLKELPSRGLLPPRFISPAGLIGPEGSSVSSYKSLEPLLRYPSVMMTGLPCFREEPEDLSVPGNPHGLLAPFARRNYYAAAVFLLKDIVKELRALFGLEREGLRIFCNSRFPEKQLAAASGLGFYGKNSLIISKDWGSGIVLAGLTLPTPVPGDTADPSWLIPGEVCGRCEICVKACPAAALDGKGNLDKTRCLQALFTELRPFSESQALLWGKRIYGCQDCQDPCPYNREQKEGRAVNIGYLGPSIPLKHLLYSAEPPFHMPELLKKTALDMKWLDRAAILRNGIIAAGNCGDPAVKNNLLPFLYSANEIISRSAEWALSRID